MGVRIIDAHMHYSKVGSFFDCARETSKVEYSKEGFLQEQSAAGIVRSIAMGLAEKKETPFPSKDVLNPMGIDLAERVETLFFCVGINPYDLNPRAIKKIREALFSPFVVGIKLYPGYYPFYVTDEIYSPIYTLAHEFQLPIVIHGGDTFAPFAILKYSHPLTVNELAVRYPSLTFVIAHFGNPWVLDTAVLITNMPNVYTDLSGLILGGDTIIKDFREEPSLMTYLKSGVFYSGHFDKMLFGTDWPLVTMKAYIEFVEELIPSMYHGLVFSENACRVFSRLDAN